MIVVFDDDARFEFNIKIDSSERGHLEEMPGLFDRCHRIAFQTSVAEEA